MQEAYMSPGAKAGVYLKHLGDGDWEIQNVVTVVSERGKGLQRELWKRILRDADREGACLLLTVGSGRGPMTSAELYDWYSRMGFNGIAGGIGSGYEGTRMERWPGGVGAEEIYT